MPNANGSVSRSALLRVLNIAKPAVGRGLFVPVLEHFCITSEEVIAYDDAIAISVTHDLPVTCAVKADLTLKLLNSLSADSMQLSITGGHLKIDCGKTHLKVPALGADSFIFKPSFGSRRFKFDVTDQFYSAIDSCLMSVGIDPTHAAQLGVTLFSDGNNMPALYSTDNATMSRHLLPGEEFPEMQVLLPTTFCRQLSSLRSQLKDKAVATISIHNSAVVARMPFDEEGEILLYGKLLTNDKPLDFEAVWDRMMPEKKARKFIELPPSWDSTFERACALADLAHPTTKMESDEDGEVTVTTKSQYGESVDTLTAEGIDMRKPFLIDPAHVTRATRLCSHFAFYPDCLILHKDNFSHLITHCVE